MPSALDSARPPLDGSAGPERSQPPLEREQRSPWLLRNAIVISGMLTVMATVLAVLVALQQPWLGLRLAAVAGQVRVTAVEVDGPAALAGVRTGERLIALASADGGPRVVLEPDDLIEDPDLLPDYRRWGRFLARQGELLGLLRQARLQLQLQDPQTGQERKLLVVPRDERSLASLPPVFWFQLLVQALIMLTAGWVMSVFPLQPATWYSGAAGLSMVVLMSCCAVYSGRELALSPALFHGLSAAGHVAGIASILGLAGILSHFPRRIAPAGTAWMSVLFAVFALWALASALWWLPSPDWAYRPMLLAGMALLVVQGWRQVRANAGQPRQQAAARAMAVPWSVGVAGIVLMQEGLLMLGLTPPIAQGWLYGLAIFTTSAAAFGLRRLRLFDLDEWVTQLMLTWGAGLGILASYQLLVAHAGFSPNVAMMAAIGVFGLVYVPLVSLFWSRVQARRSMSARDLTGGILMLGLSARTERLLHWESLLGATFRVRRIEQRTQEPPDAVLAQTRVVADGQALELPALDGLPGLTLWHRDRGARPFSRADRRMAQRLVDLAAQMIQAREAYDRGATDERERIADDLHDDLGAKLLTLVHLAEGGADRSAVAVLARDALHEMRLAVRNMKARATPVADMLADWRSETVTRLEAAGVGLDWDVQLPASPLLLGPRTVLQLTRVVREAVSNVIRHSGATHCAIHVLVSGSDIAIEIEDNGIGLQLPSSRLGGGHGLVNIETRVRRLGGAQRFLEGRSGGVLLLVRVPIEPVSTQPQRL